MRVPIFPEASSNGAGTENKDSLALTHSAPGEILAAFLRQSEQYLRCRRSCSESSIRSIVDEDPTNAG